MAGSLLRPLMVVTVLSQTWIPVLTGECKVDWDDWDKVDWDVRWEIAAAVTKTEEDGGCNPNTADKPQFAMCNPYWGDYRKISKIVSKWIASKKDRTFEVTCIETQRESMAKGWTKPTEKDGYFNVTRQDRTGQDLDEPDENILLVIGGFASKHSNRKEDRQYAFLYEQIVNWDNGWKEVLWKEGDCRIESKPMGEKEKDSEWTLDIGENEGIRSVESNHKKDTEGNDVNVEDRWFKFEICKLVYLPK